MPLFGGHGTLLTGVAEMAMWVLICAKCQLEFPHSQIGDMDLSRLLLPIKPDLDGEWRTCPHCGHAAVYERSDLRYRHF
jgi:hypothetical protein